MVDSIRIAALLVVLTGIAASSAGAKDIAFASDVAGPVEARLVRVVDGDTVLVDAAPWPDHRIRVYVRLRGVDTAELHSSCRSERDAAKRARALVARLLGTSGMVRLSNISGGKYYGRVLADVSTADGADLSEQLLARHLARPYDGGRRAKPVCASTG